MSIVKNFDPETVKDNPFQPRTSYSTKKIEELANSIEKVGLISVPVGRQLQDGTVELAVGHERKRAFIKLKKKKPIQFPVMPIEIKDLSNEAMSILSLEENLRREDISLIEMAYGIDNHLKNFPKISEKLMAEIMGMTQGNISNMRRVLKCPQKVLDKIVDGKINFTMARELLVFKDLNLGKKQYSYSRVESDKIRDEEFLMMEAIRGVGQAYGPAATVDGIKKSIFSVCRENMPRCYKNDNTSWGSSDDPLFDTAPCSKCDKSITANETKSQKLRFCTDPKCWSKKQDAHKKKMAAMAIKERDAELAKRMKVVEKELVPDEEESPALEEADQILEEKSQVTEGFSDDDDIEDFDDGDEYEPSEEEKAPTFDNDEELCRMCINKKNCDGTMKRTHTDRGGLYCLDRVTKENYEEIREKAKAVVPESMKEMVKNNAGTRADIVDVRELRMGTYSSDLKAGFALLSAPVYDGSSVGDNARTIIDRIDDPDECLTRCTTGFHYGFDSGKNSTEVLYACSNPKCLSKKKAAFTRAKNARGAAKKKAEAAAIKEAVEKTTSLGTGHIKLILKVLLTASTTNYYGDGAQNMVTEVARAFKVTDVKNDRGWGHQRDATITAILEEVDRLPEDEVAKVITEVCLGYLKYNGELVSYKIETTEALEWMGVKIPNLPQDETKKKEKVTA